MKATSHPKESWTRAGRSEQNIRKRKTYLTKTFYRKKMKTMKPRHFLKTTEVAEILNISVQHVRNLIDRGLLDAVEMPTKTKHRRQIRIPADAVEQMLVSASPLQKGGQR